MTADDRTPDDSAEPHTDILVVVSAPPGWPSPPNCRRSVPGSGSSTGSWTGCTSQGHWPSSHGPWKSWPPSASPHPDEPGQPGRAAAPARGPAGGLGAAVRHRHRRHAWRRRHQAHTRTCHYQRQAARQP